MIFFSNLQGRFTDAYLFISVSWSLHQFGNARPLVIFIEIHFFLPRSTEKRCDPLVFLSPGLFSVVNSAWLASSAGKPAYQSPSANKVSGPGQTRMGRSSGICEFCSTAEDLSGRNQSSTASPSPSETLFHPPPFPLPAHRPSRAVKARESFLSRR